MVDESKSKSSDLELWRSLLKKAGIKLENFTYDPKKDIFIPPPPYNSLEDFCKNYCCVVNEKKSCQQEFKEFLKEAITNRGNQKNLHEIKCAKGLTRTILLNTGNNVLIITAFSGFYARSIPNELEKFINNLELSKEKKDQLKGFFQRPVAIKDDVEKSCMEKLDQVKELFSEHIWTESELPAINEIAQEINAEPFNLTKTLKKIKNNCICLTGADRGCIILKNSAVETLSRFYECSEKNEACDKRFYYFNEVIRSGKPQLITDTTGDERFASDKSELDIPLFYMSEPVGLIHVSKDKTNHFTKHHQQLLMALSGYAAMAIHNSREFEKKVKEHEEKEKVAKSLNKELYTLMHINQQLVKEESDIDKLIYTFLTGVTHKNGCAFPRAFFFLYDEGKKRLKGKMGIGALSKREANDNWKKVGEASFYACIENYKNIKNSLSKTPVNAALNEIIISINGINGPFAKAMNGSPQRYNAPKSDWGQGLKDLNLDGPIAFVPLIGREGVLGVLVVDRCFFRKKKPISKNELDILTLFANQAALALENFYLIQRDSFLSELILSLTGEILNWKGLLNEIIRIVMDKVDSSWGSIFLMNKSTDKLELMTTTGTLLKQRLNNNEIIEYKLGEGLTGWVAKHGRTLRLDHCADKEELTKYGDDLKWKGVVMEEKDFKPEVTPFLAVPIKKGDNVEGVIRLARDETGKTFTYQEELLMEAVASALAIVIENAEWVKNLRESTYRTVHDLNTLTGGAESILDNIVSGRAPKERLKKWQTMALVNIKEQRHIIDNLYQAGRMELGLLRVHKEVVDIEKTIIDCKAFFLAELSLKKKNVKIIIHNPQCINNVYTCKDGIDSIICNLLSNAIKYAPNDSIIEININQINKDIMIIVVNQGLVILPEEQRSLFDNRPFWSINSKGLGLIICNEWAKRMGGSLEVRSDSKTGTCFTLTLPNN